MGLDSGTTKCGTGASAGTSCSIIVKEVISLVSSTDTVTSNSTGISFCTLLKVKICNNFFIIILSV